MKNIMNRLFDARRETTKLLREVQELKMQLVETGKIIEQTTEPNGTTYTTYECGSTVCRQER